MLSSGLNERSSYNVYCMWDQKLSLSLDSDSEDEDTVFESFRVLGYNMA
jgi:hypothetical protein